MEGAQRSLLMIGFMVVAVALAVVEADLSRATYFYWAPDRGAVTGSDSLELGLTKYGGSGITTKASFLYGSIEMKIKLVAGNSAGTVTTFYMSSTDKTVEGDFHDEIDFEFLGNQTGMPYTIHTNIFTKGKGNREEQFKIWFDPTSDYHTYTIFWNPYAVVWLIDGTPLRVFRNYHDSEINFPDSQAMRMYSSLWNADSWATQGGKVKTDWSLAPFKAYFQGLRTDACYWQGFQSIWKCANSNNPNNWWANSAFYKLSPSQLGKLNWVRNNFMIYNYCTDYKRFLPLSCDLSIGTPLCDIFVALIGVFMQ
ncbi:hypothetical protein V2J09_004281 [Rumex salicifolius]